VRADLEAFVNASIDNPPAPITDTTDPAWTGDYLGQDGTLVPNPDHYMFFDHIHPTRVGHALVGDFMIQAVDAALAAAGA
jgi:phospholipase/lecithinase/hemolysin